MKERKINFEIANRCDECGTILEEYEGADE